MRTILLTFLCAFALSLPACGGGGANMETYSTNSTMGQELVDLKKAYDNGIISEREYKNAKEDIMDRYDD